VSGELSTAARAELEAYISRNPGAREEYKAIRRRYKLLQGLPIPEPSAQQRVMIPEAIKAGVRRELQRQKKARRDELLRRWAGSRGMALAAALMLVALITLGFRSSQSWRREQAAIALIDRVKELSGRSATPYEQAVTAVDAAVEEMEKESPMLASVQDTSLSALMEALVSLPQDEEEYTDGPFGPGGSY